ncbi:MAG: hypothetical protein HKN82_10445 [Akkermansiaceae bacterium]|nr:hypothetical protein [Akkermansiaceae bacterium]NNM29520.1 hypothetical protein [Akkermansiaceae bacterium]
MGKAAISLLAWGIVAAGGFSQDLPPLPKWDEEDVEKLRTGEIVPGQELLREVLGDLVPPTLPPEVEPESPPPEPEVPSLEQFPSEIDSEFLGEYFARRPAGFILDPQELLSRQEFLDRVSFLEYHAGDSEVDLYVYLFDARQELPEGVTIESVFSQNFADGGPTALVFYFLGMPEKAQMVVSDAIRASVTAEELQRARKAAIQEAFEKSDPADQLDNFSVELSIRLYWFEKAMTIPEATPATATSEGAPSARVEPPEPEPQRIKPLLRGVGILSFLALAGGLGWLGRLIADRRMRYVFPDLDGGPLLGAPHAAGVGAVVSFSSSQLSPSQQRDEVPDYLQKM